jgi:hypothetical protein
MQTFFGPWQLRATTEESHFFERFVITGSAGADGVYEPDRGGAPTQIAVAGEAWAIDFQARFQEGEWFSYDPVRTTRFVPAQGLTVWLTGDEIHEPDAFVFAHLLAVQCVSTDPTLSPPMIPNPFDFSVPD